MRTARSSSRRGGVCLSACWNRHPPGCRPGDLPVWSWRPPSQIPLNFPLGCGPGDPPWPDPLNFPLGSWPGDPPWPDPLNFLLGCGPGDPPRSPSTSTLGVGLETCNASRDTTPRPAARHAGIPPAMHAGIPPPCEQNDRQVQKYYLAPNFVCGR